MKIIETRVLLNEGPFAKSSALKRINRQIKAAIKSVQWPHNSGSFTLHDKSHGSGVTPIKDACMESLKNEGWEHEVKLDIVSVVRAGPIDAGLRIKNKYFCVEWETGNISSTHRAINKMAVGLLNGHLIGGVLILPSREMYKYLTDRVGSFSEIEPYFPLWQSLKVREGYLAIISIEHDGVSKNVPKIPKGTDGRALL